MVPEIWSSTDRMFLSLWAIFCPFNSPLSQTARKIKNWKKWKRHLEISSFYKIVPKIIIICYTVPEIWCVMDVIVIFHFGLCFSLLRPLTTPKNEKFEIMKKRSWGIILQKCTKNNDHMLCTLWMQFFFSLWTIFSPFTPTNNPKNKNFKKNEEDTWRYHH